jgi:hypothetical protein
MILIFRNILCFISILFFSLKAYSQCPKSEAWVGGRVSGYFTKIVFQNQDSINADRFCSGVRKETQIDSFSIIIIRDTSIIFRLKNIGSKFENSLKSVIKEAKVNDKVLFFDIWGTDYDKNRVHLDPLEYHLTE